MFDSVFDVAGQVYYNALELQSFADQSPANLRNMCELYSHAFLRA